MFTVYSLIFYIALIELTLWFVIAFLPGAIGIRIGNLVTKLSRKPRFKTSVIITLALLSAIFLNSVNESRVAAANKMKRANDPHISLSDHIQLNNMMFRAQRNSYLSGFCLCLFVILWRTIFLVREGHFSSPKIRAKPAGDRPVEAQPPVPHED